jgi:hypothetical protein
VKEIADRLRAVRTMYAQRLATETDEGMRRTLWYSIEAIDTKLAVIAKDGRP